MSRAKILPLESLRGLAALSVAMFHFWNRSILTNNIFVHNAPLMVDFFFVLSGFVIAMSYSDKIKTVSDLMVFQTKRFWRLYPLHLFTLLGFLAIECLKYAVEMNTGIVANNPAFSKSNLEAFINNFIMTQGLFLDRAAFNFPSWSISVEFFTYFIFGLILLCGQFKWVLCSAVMLTAYGILFAYDPMFNSMDLRIFRCLYAFTLGALGFFLTQKIDFKIPDFLSALSLLLSIFAVCFLANTNWHSLIPIIFLLTVLSLSLSDPMGITSRILSVKPLVYLGTISYSIYMIHAGVWWVFNQVLSFVFKVPITIDDLGRTKIELEPNLASVVTILGLLIVILASRFTYIFIEDRFRGGLKRARSS